jgi:hypothetical protein
MAVGLPLKTTYADGDVYSASDVNDTNGTVNLVGQTLNFYAGKNKIINGDFGIWQRGTSFTNPANTFSFTSDRWSCGTNSALTSSTVTQQAFTPGAAPVAGYEGSFFYRSTLTTIASSTIVDHYYRIENVRTFAGQTATLSFWAKADSARVVGVDFQQNFGSGGSSTVTSSTTNFNLTTSWQRFTLTYAFPSLAGKTIGTNNSINITFHQAVVNGSVLDIWGVQLEAGSTATAFQTATGTIQGELAACQRYYFRSSVGTNTNAIMGLGFIDGGSVKARIGLVLPSQMRTNPTSLDYSGIRIFDANFSGATVTSASLLVPEQGQNMAFIELSLSTALGALRPAWLSGLTSTGYIGVSAEL